jgi:hypothetical protein
MTKGGFSTDVLIAVAWLGASPVVGLCMARMDHLDDT